MESTQALALQLRRTLYQEGDYILPFMEEMYPAIALEGLTWPAMIDMLRGSTWKAPQRSPTKI